MRHAANQLPVQRITTRAGFLKLPKTLLKIVKAFAARNISKR
jgi:hypothetical protein